MPKVSVITPVFNAEKYIAETIESVLQQTFADWEMLIIDDESKDQTVSIVERFVQQYPDKIRLLQQSNQGPGAARNHGIREAQGEYIALLDADDLWLPHRLEEGVKVLDQNACIGLVHGKTRRLMEDGQIVDGPKRDPQYLNGWIFENLLKRKAHISCLTVLFRKECIDKVGGFDEARECIGVEDRDLWLRIARAYQIAYIEREVGVYRVLSTGISRDNAKMLKGKTYVINKACEASGKKTLGKQALAMIHKELADEYFLKEEYQASSQEYKRSLEYWPWSMWSWINWMRSVRRQ